VDFPHETSNFSNPDRDTDADSARKRLKNAPNESLQPSIQPYNQKAMTREELINGAAQVCIDEREAHLIMFTEGIFGYVCPNEGIITENRAIFKGTYRECQIWVEQRGLSAALRFILERQHLVPELSDCRLTLDQCLADFSRTPRSLTAG